MSSRPEDELEELEMSMVMPVGPSWSCLLRLLVLVGHLGGVLVPPFSKLSPVWGVWVWTTCCHMHTLVPVRDREKQHLVGGLRVVLSIHACLPCEPLELAVPSMRTEGLQFKPILRSALMGGASRLHLVPDQRGTIGRGRGTTSGVPACSQAAA